MICLDLPELYTILFTSGNSALRGDCRENCKTIINGRESYSNTLIMKSKVMRKEDYDDLLDLPSLTDIHCDGKCWNVHSHIGYIVLESKYNVL